MTAILVLLLLLAVSTSSFNLNPRRSFISSTNLAGKKSKKTKQPTDPNPETKTKPPSPTTPIKKPSSILDTPAFLQKKLAVLETDFQSLTAEQIPAAKASAEEATAEWGENIAKMEKETAFVRDRMYNETMASEVNSKIEVTRSILPVIDNFQRAFQNIKVDEGTRGKEMEDEYLGLYEEFLQLLEKMGVTEVVCLGKEFDFNSMEVISQVSE